MLKRTTSLALLFSVITSMQAAQPQRLPLSTQHTVKVSDIPHVPVSLELNVAPHTLVSGLGFAGCMAAIQLYKEGVQLRASQDADPIIKKAKHEQGEALINRSYILFAAGAAAIFNKQILGMFIRQG